MKLTVIIRNYAPLIHMQEPVSHRSVQIELTKEQMEKLIMRRTHIDNGKDFHEEISHCFIEPTSGASHDS